MRAHSAVHQVTRAAPGAHETELGSFPDPQSGEHNLRMAGKPWKCRLRLHDWEVQENPDTHKQYKVCLRCDAYKEKRGLLPGPGDSGNFHAPSI
jgi:hypothetical protein